jgi:hypothetical protein
VSDFSNAVSCYSGSTVAVCLDLKLAMLLVMRS